MPVLPFCSSSQLLHTAQVCLTSSLRLGPLPSFQLIRGSWADQMQLLLPPTGLGRTSPQGPLTQSCQMLFLTREVDLTSSALLRVWLNTKTSCAGPVYQAMLAALSNSLSFVHPSANICPMKKFYLQLFDTHCSIRCKHWITFDLQPHFGRIILGSPPLIASFVICYLATLSLILHVAHPLHWDIPFNSVSWNQMFSKNLLYLGSYI